MPDAIPPGLLCNCFGSSKIIANFAAELKNYKNVIYSPALFF